MTELQTFLPKVDPQWTSPVLSLTPGPPASFGENITDPSVYSFSLYIRYKDGDVIPVEDWDDVSVQMTKEDGSVISVLTINNLSHQRYDGYDIVKIRCFSYT